MQVSLGQAARRRQMGERLGALPGSLVLLVAGFLVGFPFLWMLRTSFMPEDQALIFPPIWIPTEPTLGFYLRALTVQPFLRYVLNSVIVAACVVLGQLLTASMGAYAFARLRFPGRDKLFLLYLATTMIPGQVTIVPMYVMISRVGLVNDLRGLIIPSLCSAYLTFLLRQSFLSIPSELEDAVKIDGAGYLRTYMTIFLPLSGPMLATCGLLAFMGSWNSFLWPLIVIRSKELRTLPIGLRAIQQEMTMGHTEYPLLMASATLAMLPILIFFVFLQRFFIESIALTGVKG